MQGLRSSLAFSVELAVFIWQFDQDACQEHFVYSFCVTVVAECDTTFVLDMVSLILDLCARLASDPSTEQWSCAACARSRRLQPGASKHAIFSLARVIAIPFGVEMVVHFFVLVSGMCV